MKSVFGNLVKVKVEVSTAKLCTNLAHKICLFFVYFIFFGIMHKLKPLVYNDFQFKIYYNNNIFIFLILVPQNYLKYLKMFTDVHQNSLMFTC